MRKYALPILLVIEMGIFLPVSGIRFDDWNTFLTGFQFYLSDLIPQATPLLVLSLGMTIVLITAGIDLSVGSMVALVACVMSLFEGSGTFWWFAIPTGLAVAIGLGMFNGLLIARLDVPPIVATLGTLFFYRGLCEAVMRGAENAPFYSVPGYEWFGELTGSLVVAAVILLAGGSYFQLSRWRREILMLGGNRVAARYAGIPVDRRLFQVYTLMGLLAFAAAVCATAKDTSVTATWRMGMELQVIVAVVLGGTRIDGGAGSVLGSVFGVLMVAVLEEGLRGAAMSDLKPILLGGLLFVGVWLNTHADAKNRKMT